MVTWLILSGCLGSAYRQITPPPLQALPPVPPSYTQPPEAKAQFIRDEITQLHREIPVDPIVEDVLAGRIPLPTGSWQDGRPVVSIPPTDLHSRLELALEHSPNDPHVLMAVGLLAEANDLLLSAQRFYRLALSLDPQLPGLSQRLLSLQTRLQTVH